VFSDATTTLIGTIVVLLIALSWHEAAHAWVADRLGDPTARMLGRVTLNPLKHLDLFLSFVLPAILYFAGAPIIGGGKPVPINVMNFRHRARDFMLVALAGPGANLLLAAVFALMFIVSVWSGLLPAIVVANPFGPDHVYAPTFLPWYEITNERTLELVGQSISEKWLKVGVLINLGLAAFNMLPIPPLDGSRVIGWMLPGPLQRRWYAFDRIGIVMVLLLFFAFDGIRYVAQALFALFALAGYAIDEILALKSLV
jgi:Zn-dependent protease